MFLLIFFLSISQVLLASPRERERERESEKDEKDEKDNRRQKETEIG